MFYTVNYKEYQKKFIVHSIKMSRFIYIKYNSIEWFCFLQFLSSIIMLHFHSIFPCTMTIINIRLIETLNGNSFNLQTCRQLINNM